MTERLNAGEICSRSVVFAERAMAIDDAAGLMRTHHVGTLVVVEESAAGRQVVGMLTDRDIVTGIVAKKVDPARVRVEDLMSTDLVVAREEDTVIDLLRSLRGCGFRRLPVVDAQGLLVGLVALDDLLEIVAEEMRLIVDAIGTERRREQARRP